MKRTVAKSRGSVGDIMVMGIFVIAMMIVMYSFLDCVELIRVKNEIGQLTRRYILVAETNGYLPESDVTSLMNELEILGMSDCDLTGTTFAKADFGSTVTVCIKGKIKDKYEISETKVSTAKY